MKGLIGHILNGNGNIDFLQKNSENGLQHL